MKSKHILVAIFLFVATLFVYKTIYPNPRNWYDHYLYLSKSILSGRVDINLPEFYHDKVQFAGKTYLPFPPGPALAMIPFLVLNKNATEQEISVILGAANIALMFLLLKKFTNQKNAFLLALFFGFGTVHFWSAVVGTAWYFAHIAAVFFLLLALICHFSKRDFLSGILFSLAVLCRYPLLLGYAFFILNLWKDRSRLILFLAGTGPLFAVQAAYSWMRFGNIFKTGYQEVYESYAKSPYPVTTLQYLKPGSKAFNYMDIRNIPLHLFTFIFMPPRITFNPFTIAPSPFGMGIIFTTPLLFLSFANSLRKKLTRNLTIAILLICTVVFFHYSQGWVQFGYRFLLDFIVFVMILLAQKFKPTKLTIFLLLISVIVNIWGTLQGIKLGW